MSGDCITLAFKLLPNNSFRALAEISMLECLIEADLTQQNRLFDHDKKFLYSMTMSELHALAMIAELGFICGCEHATISNTHVRPSERCMAAISLVGSCSRIIFLAWRLPESKRDGEVAVQAFENNHGQTQISTVQIAVKDHVDKIRSLCVIDNIDHVALEDPEISSARRSALSRLHRECQIATKTLERPNVHRMYDMAHCTLPMVGHMSSIGELVFEKTHQCLKRALRQSNSKNVRISSMLSIAVDDWQGRVTSIISGALGGEERSLFAFYRLLYGR